MSRILSAIAALILLFPPMVSAEVFTLNNATFADRDPRWVRLDGFFEIEGGAVTNWGLDFSNVGVGSGGVGKRFKPASWDTDGQCGRAAQIDSVTLFFVNCGTPSAQANLSLVFDRPLSNGAQITPASYIEGLYVFDAANITVPLYFASGSIAAPEPTTLAALLSLLVLVLLKGTQGRCSQIARWLACRWGYSSARVRQGWATLSPQYRAPQSSR